MEKIAKGFGVKLFVCVFVVAGFLGVSWAAEPVKKSDEGKVLLVKKADLIVEKIEIKKVAQDPAIITPGKDVKVRYKVEIKVTVKNKAIGANAASTENSLTGEGRSRGSGGAFKVLVEWSDNPPAGFNFLGEAGVTALAPGASKMVFFEQWLPKGTERKYRVTVDHLNWIEEWDEKNNVNSAGYIAR